MAEETASSRYWKGKVGVPLERDLLNLVDHHAEALGVSRRALVKRTVEEFTADTAALVAAEQKAKATDALMKIHKTLRGDRE